MVYCYATDGHRVWSFQSKKDRDEWISAGKDSGRRILTEQERRQWENIRRRAKRRRGYDKYDGMGLF